MHSLLIHVGNLQRKVVPHDGRAIWVGRGLIELGTKLQVVHLILARHLQHTVGRRVAHTHQGKATVAQLGGYTQGFGLGEGAALDTDSARGAAPHAARVGQEEALVLGFPQDVAVSVWKGVGRGWFSCCVVLPLVPFSTPPTTLKQPNSPILGHRHLDVLARRSIHNAHAVLDGVRVAGGPLP